MTFESNSILAASACPVLPPQTCSYVGFGTVPPAYPAVAEMTPFNRANKVSVHQKHPPPKTAICVPCLP